MKILFTVFFLLGSSFKAVGVVGELPPDIEKVMNSKVQMEKAWDKMEQAAEVKNKALDAFINSLTVTEGQNTFSLSDPTTLSKLQSAIANFKSTQEALEEKKEQYEANVKKQSHEAHIEKQRKADAREQYKTYGKAGDKWSSKLDAVLKNIPTEEKNAYKAAVIARAKATRAYNQATRKEDRAYNAWQNYLQIFYRADKKVHHLQSKLHDSEYNLQSTRRVSAMNNAKRELKRAQDQARVHRMSAARAQLRWADLLPVTEAAGRNYFQLSRQEVSARKALPQETQKALSNPN